MEDLEKLIQNAIIKTVKEILEEYENDFKFNTTRYGKLIELGSNYGIVKTNGQDYKCKLKDGLNLSVGDSVIVIVPNGNFNMKYIDGKLKKQILK